MIKDYLNPVYHTLKGETWNEVSGYEGYYEVSSFGRIRSLDRYIPHPRHGQQFVAGKIIRQKIVQHKNIKTGKPSIDLQVALSRDGKMKFYNVRRLVYAAFINSINYDDDGLYVINKNGNGYNCKVENLLLVTKSKKSLRAFKRKRVVESYLKSADRSKWTIPFGGAVNRKPVGKYSLSGKLLASYNSITEASKMNSVGEKEIINVAKGRVEKWKGVTWKYHKKPKKKIKKL